jgi:hypothetical protein
VTIEIPEDRAERFRRQAQAHGMTIDQWLLELASQAAPPGSISHLQKTNAREWLRQFRAWAESHDRTTPLLADEAIRRESLYPDRV